jgi:hypothetical protein
MNSADNNNDLNHFLTGCHCATGDLLNLAESLERSIYAIELKTATIHPDAILVKLLTERIRDLNERIGDRL